VEGGRGPVSTSGPNDQRMNSTFCDYFDEFKNLV
jgi:hypothetical protein